MIRSVLLDGSFDPLHAGHVAYIRAARESFPDHRLVVAIASDDQIRAKGREPLLDQQTRGDVVSAIKGVDAVFLKQQPTEQVLAALKPGAYVKGQDWDGRLPDEQLVACSLHGIQIVYLGGVSDSSSDRLRAWARSEDAKHLAALERLVQSQTPASTPWQPVTDYSFEARKEVEGKHPRLIKDVFQPTFVFDVGCGPDEILCRLLREIGVHAKGIDPQGKEPPDQPWRGSILNMPESAQGIADLVVCREVLEHLPIVELRLAVTNLCLLSSRFVYVTTRFAKSPSSLLSVDTSDDLDPTHITMLNQNFLRTLFVLEGAKRRADLEERMDWQRKGRVLVYEVAR